MRLLPDAATFPIIKDILHFEGLNGPDGIKRKSPGQDEPWHFYDPFDESDTKLIKLIQAHYANLSQALKDVDCVRASFEAAWLAHALVDGLTPAHHYPFEDELKELRGGKGLETRTTFKTKLIMPGKNRRSVVTNNWKMWGGGGLYTTHVSFEMGVATLIKPLTFNELVLSPTELLEVEQIGIVEVFKRAAREIGVLDMYNNYYKKGWTPKLAWQVRHKLGPLLVRTVTVAWYLAYLDSQSGLKSKQSKV